MPRHPVFTETLGLDQTRAHGGKAEDLESLLTSHPEDILKLLNDVEITYGGLEAYALHLGLNQRYFDQLREHFISKF